MGAQIIIGANMAYLTKRENGFWYIRYSVNGKEKWKSTHKRRESDAKRALLRFNQEPIPEVGPEADPFVGAYWDAYTVKFKGNYSKASWDIKAQTWSRFLKALNATRLSDITDDKIRGMRDSWTLQPESFNTYRRTFSGIWETGKKAQLHALPQNPCQNVKPLRAPRENKAVLMPDEVERLCWFAVQHEQEFGQVRNIVTMFVLCGYFGLRSKEAQNARWEWIDWERGNLTVTQSGEFDTKNRKNRTIPLFDGARKWLEPLRRDSGYIYRPDFTLLSPKEGRMVSFKRAWNTVVKRAGYVDDKGRHTVDRHFLRHSWITNLLYAGASPYSVADWSGHSDLHIQQNYRHAIAPKEGSTKLL